MLMTFGYLLLTITPSLNSWTLVATAEGCGGTAADSSGNKVFDVYNLPSLAISAWLSFRSLWVGAELGGLKAVVAPETASRLIAASRR
jgi:hypothetical protein